MMQLDRIRRGSWIAAVILAATMRLALAHDVEPVPAVRPTLPSTSAPEEAVIRRLPQVATGPAPPNCARPVAALEPAPPNTIDLSDDLLRRLEAAERDLSELRQQQSQPADDQESFLDGFQPDADRYPQVRLSGFIQLDTGFFSQDANSLATLGDIQNGTGFRRARLQALGYLTEMTRFSVEMDFGNVGVGRPSFQDVWGEQTHLPYVGNLRVGQYRQPITMDSWTNVRHLEFLERSAPFQALDPCRRVGAMGWRNDDEQRTLVAASVYGTGLTFFNGANTVYNTMGIDNPFGTVIGDQGGISFATRATHLLYYDDLAEGRYLLHVGVGWNFSEIGGNGFGNSPGARTYQARAIPEFFVGDAAGGGLTVAGTPNFVDTGRFFATSYNLAHVEFAGNCGAAHFQAEYLATGVNQLNGPMVFYDGAYIQCGYFFTGESCGYNKYFGALDYNVQPNSDFFGLGPKRGICGWGAWEVAARWSYLDLSASNVNSANYLPGPPGSPLATATIPPSVNPGALNESTVALNWWWNTCTRVQFNWIHAMLDNNLRGFSATDIYALRFQTEF